MFKKILVPVDGSEGSWRALEHAVVLGEKFESTIIVANVIQPYNNAALLAIPLEMAQEKMASYPHAVEYSLEVGHPSERIIALAKKIECDAIVLGSRGLSGIAEFFLGSVSSKVAQYASVPVLIVK